jgi:S1-C subfamily serine protease
LLNVGSSSRGRFFHGRKETVRVRGLYDKIRDKNSMKKAFIIIVLGSISGLIAIQIDRWYRNHSTENYSLSTQLREVALRKVSENRVIPAPIGLEAAATKILPSVVSINILQKQQVWGDEALVVPTGSASGVILSQDGIILTNNHVVEGAYIVKVDVPTIKNGTSRPRTFYAKIVGRDPVSDIAVLKIDADDLKPADIALEKPKVGEWVLAVGNPSGYEGSVSVGVVSSLSRSLPVERSVLVDSIQTDASVNPGNSGGALTNSRGELIGIPTVIATRSGGSEGISFAIPIGRALKVADDIRKHGRVRYGWLGIRVFDSQVFSIKSNLDILKNFHKATIPEQGLVLREVAPGSPAAKAGLSRFDVILKIDEKELTQPIDFVSYFIDKRTGDIVEVTYWSKGKTHTVSIKLVDPTG